MSLPLIDPTVCVNLRVRPQTNCGSLQSQPTGIASKSTHTNLEYIYLGLGTISMALSELSGVEDWPTYYVGVWKDHGFFGRHWTNLFHDRRILCVCEWSNPYYSAKETNQGGLILSYLGSGGLQKQIDLSLLVSKNPKTTDGVSQGICIGGVVTLRKHRFGGLKGVTHLRLTSS